MGARLELSPHLLSLMSAEDQARYGGATDTTIIVDKTPTTSRRDADERREQATFANWLSLQNSKRGPKGKIPFVWHSTHRASTASVGCPDFYVGICGKSLWFEFKRNASCRLSDE
jgi:hypothetical protein